MYEKAVCFGKVAFYLVYIEGWKALYDHQDGKFFKILLSYLMVIDVYPGFYRKDGCHLSAVGIEINIDKLIQVWLFYCFTTCGCTEFWGFKFRP